MQPNIIAQNKMANPARIPCPTLAYCNASRTSSPPILSLTTTEIRCAIACAPVQDGTPIAIFSAANAELVAEAKNVAAANPNSIFFVDRLLPKFILLHPKMRTGLHMQTARQPLQCGGKQRLLPL